VSSPFSGNLVSSFSYDTADRGSNRGSYKHLSYSCLGVFAAMRIAVVQPRLELGAVERNLARVRQLVRDAHRERAPRVSVLPEALTSPNVYSPATNTHGALAYKLRHARRGLPWQRWEAIDLPEAAPLTGA
jgi:hypothetical protein